MGIAQATHTAEPASRRNNDAGFALDGFDQHCDRLRPDSLLQSREVAERNAPETRCERTEALPVFRFRRKRDDRGGAAVKIAVRDNDFGPVARHPFDSIAPSPRGLYGSLNGFR